jgi:radical SAM protein with 4Fe4S-binding SPASM domain
LLSTPDQIYQNLSEQYKIVCFVDLAEMAVSHNAVFSLFKFFHKSAYEDNERLVFYSSQEITQDFVNHIQRAASRIDISNFFILICSNQDLTEKLKKANQLYGYDNFCMSSVTVDLEPTRSISNSKFFNLESFCPLPFSAADINTSGKILPCCKFKGNFGNLNSTSLNSAFQSEAAQKIRNQMQQGEKPIECRVCWQAENHGVTSLRQHVLIKLQDKCDHSWIDDLKIRNITISPSSLCNFKCRICSPWTSSQVAVEELQNTNDVKQINQLKQFIKLSDSDLLNHLQANLVDIGKDVEYLKILGGEPFMLPGLTELLTQLIDSGQSKNMQLEFNTNVSSWPEEIIQLFEQFRAVEILLSVDNIGTRFEIERGGVWSEIENNIKNFVGLKSSSIEVKLAVTVNIQNLLYLDDIINFSRQLGLEIVWWYLEQPDHLCIDNVTESVKQLVYQKYHNHPTEELQRILQRVQNSPATSGQRFIDYMDKLDQRRAQLFAQTHSEIYAAMKNTCTTY